jgi:hypothetical protein
MLVANGCNPSYLGDRDQEGSGLKPARANRLKTLSRKHPTQKRAGGVAQEVESLPSKPWFKSHFHKKKKKKPEKKKPTQNKSSPDFGMWDWYQEVTIKTKSHCRSPSWCLENWRTGCWCEESPQHIWCHKCSVSWAWWHTSLIPVTQEVEAGRYQAWG